MEKKFNNVEESYAIQHSTGIQYVVKMDDWMKCSDNDTVEVGIPTKEDDTIIWWQSHPNLIEASKILKSDFVLTPPFKDHLRK